MNAQVTGHILRPRWVSSPRHRWPMPNYGNSFTEPFVGCVVVHGEVLNCSVAPHHHCAGLPCGSALQAWVAGDVVEQHGENRAAFVVRHINDVFGESFVYEQHRPARHGVGGNDWVHP